MGSFSFEKLHDEADEEDYNKEHGRIRHVGVDGLYEGCVADAEEGDGNCDDKFDALVLEDARKLQRAEDYCKYEKERNPNCEQL